MKKDEEKKKRLLTYLPWILLGILLVLILFNRVGDIDVEAPGGFKVSIKEKDVPQYEERVKERVENFEKQLSTMDKLINQRKITKIYRDSIDKLIYIRKQNVNSGRYLLERFNDFKQMNSRQKEEFLTEVITFLNQEEDMDVDFGLVATELVWKNENEDLKGENQELKEENQKLKSQIAGLTETITNLKMELKRLVNKNRVNEREKERLKNLYAEALNRISNLEKNLSTNPTSPPKAYMDTSSMAALRDQLEALEESNQSLFDSLGDYKNRLANIRNVRVDNPFWEPVKAKRKKRKGAYLLRDCKEIKLEFALNYNYPISRDKEELKLVFFIAQSDSEYKQIIWNRKIKLNQTTTLILKEDQLKDRSGQNIKFKEGIYTVQIFHPPTSEDKPILIRNFKVVKAWF